MIMFSFINKATAEYKEIFFDFNMEDIRGNKIYLSKINYYLNNGYSFDHVVIPIDISDLYDDNVSYRLNKDFTVKDNYERGEKLKLRRFLRKNFPLTNFYMFVIVSI